MKKNLKAILLLFIITFSMSGCSTKFYLKESLGIEKGHQKEKYFLPKYKVRKDYTSLYLYHNKLYKDAYEIYPQIKATRSSSSYHGQKINFSKELCKKFNIKDLSDIRVCGRIKNFLFVVDTGEIGYPGGYGDLQYIDATNALKTLLKKARKNDFSFMQNSQNRALILVLMDQEHIINLIKKESSKISIQNYYKFAKLLKLQTPLVHSLYNKRMRYFHFIENYNSIVHGNSIKDVQVLISDADGQNNILMKNEKLKRLRDLEYRLILTDLNIKRVEKYYSKISYQMNKDIEKYNQARRLERRYIKKVDPKRAKYNGYSIYKVKTHLVKIYRDSKKFDNYLNAYTLTNYIKDLDSAYRLASTKDELNRVDINLAPIVNIEKAKDISKLSLFIQKYPKSALIPKAKIKLAQLKADKAKALRLSLESAQRKSIFSSFGYSCSETEWNGEYDKNHTPIGKGTLKCYNKFSNKSGAIIKITSNNAKIFKKGKVSVYVRQYSGWSLFFGSEYDTSSTYSENFSRKSQISSKINTTMSQAISDFNQMIQRKNSERRSSSSRSNYSYCASSDTCFRVVKEISSKYHEYEIKCTKGQVGSTKCISRKGSKWATNCPTIRVGYHYSMKEAGNRACE